MGTDLSTMENVSINGGCPESLQGAKVRFAGLQSRADLNGLRGTVMNWLADRRRYNVRVDSGEIIAVKPSNLLEIETVVTNEEFWDDVTEGERLVKEGGHATQRLTGATVEFQWLNGRSDLNGKKAVVEAFHGGAGRFSVQVTSSGEVIAVKPGNIKTVAPYTHHHLIKAAKDAEEATKIHKSVGAGDLITLKSDLTTDSKEPLELKKGTRGTVVRMDKDGDAIIKFDGHNTRHWVYKEKFSKISVRMKADEPSEAPAEPKSPLKARATNTQPTSSTAPAKAAPQTKKGGVGLRVVF